MFTSVAALHPGPVMVDIQGLALNSQEIQRLQNPLVGGVILFARNFSSPEQLSQLCAHIHAVRKQPLLLAVDHEGGRVQRFCTQGFTPIPSMRSLGNLWEHNASLALRLASDAAYIMGLELRACGVDFSFAPVLDLDWGVSSVIGDRAFHASPLVVTELARAVILGLSKAGMGACGKHFPGHGAVAADSHLEIPVDPRPLDRILAMDAAPYVWLGDLILPSVMPAHVIYSEVDSLPAGFSKVWVQEVLRGRLAYDGVVFSDDLTMEGASVAGDILGRAQAALQAGCDMVLVCNRPDLADELLARLASYQPPTRSAQRLSRLIPSAAVPGWNILQSNVEYQNARQRLQKAI